MAEAVTLAHVVRPAVLAHSLPASRYRVTFASADRYRYLLGDTSIPFRPIRSLPESQFLQALAKGKPLHDTRTLCSYVEEDLALLREIKPDVVVGDLRQSLAISARLAGVPYAAVMNAYWSPYASPAFTVPAHPLVPLLGPRVMNTLFRLVRPAAMAAHCVPMNRARANFGLTANGYDLRRMYNDADVVLHPETPDLVPTSPHEAPHHYIGPILWSPSVALPSWWDRLPASRPVVYVTLGSSGSGRLLQIVVEALKEEAVSLIVATVHAEVPLADNVYAAHYLPGMEAARRSSLVICNGGSPTSHQALAAGTPVLGIAANMDQHLNMHYVARAGAGLCLRSDSAKLDSVRRATRTLLAEPSYTEAASRVANSFRAWDCTASFRVQLDAMLGIQRSATASA